jgi:hypothetical protein
MKVAGVFLFLIICIFSCDRKEFNEYVGNYECRKLTFNWKSGGPNEYILTENESIQVVKKKKYLVFDGFTVHIDSIKPNENHQFIANSFNYTLRFNADSIFFSRDSLVENGGSTITYFGVKED